MRLSGPPNRWFRPDTKALWVFAWGTNVLKTFLSVLDGLFPITGASAQCGGPEAPAAVIPPVDLNKPVTNPKLVAAIRNHQQTQTNETASKLFAELKTAVFL